jgi:hypothetical protein
MIRFELRLLPEEGANPSELKAISSANAVAEHSFQHLKKLIGKKKCRRHPSSPNKIRVFAVKNGDPKAELVSYCCPLFVKMLK